jgi:hypothetical protein
MGMEVGGASPLGGSAVFSYHPEQSTPAKNNFSEKVLSASAAGSSTNASSSAPSSNDLDNQLQKFMIQVGQAILKNGQDGWARAKEDDDDS